MRSVQQAQPSRVRRATGARLTLLDGFELVSDGVAVRLPMSSQRLVAFVALRRRPLLRAYVAGSLWPDTFDDRAHASLRSALWRLHRVGCAVVDVAGSRLQLGTDVRVDLHEAELLARQALDESAVEPIVDTSALVCDLLPDWYDDWLVIERERFRQLRLRALESLCSRLTGAGRLDEALAVGLAAVAGEPLRESAHRAVIGVHLADGNAVEALRQYRLCERLLRDELGVEPSEQIRRLVGRRAGTGTVR